MKSRILIFILLAIAVSGCFIENDISYPLIQADIETFEVEGQVSSVVNRDNRTVKVTMPFGTPLSDLKIKTLSMPEGVSCINSPGETIDLSEPVKLTLKLYQEYVWTVSGTNAPEGKENPGGGGDNPGGGGTPPAEGKQLANMDFDSWFQEKGSVWYPFPEGTPDEEKVWDSANKGTSTLSINTTTPDKDIVAVGGEGKFSAKLKSDFAGIFGFGKFAAGNLFTGRFVGLKGLSGAELEWGIPFSDKPKALEGYFHYLPVAINYADKDHSDLKGTMDIGQIQVMLTDWEEPFRVITSESKFVDTENDPNIIAYGKLEQGEATEGFTKFSINIDYRNERTPKYVVIVCASSKYGDYFTGGRGSTLYVDEFKFVY